MKKISEQGLGWGLGFIFSICSLFLVETAPAFGAMGGPEATASSRLQPYIGMHGMVVSDDGDASRWGAEILRKGGNAVDAAVATAFALAVTRPHYAALGGGGFLLYCPKPKNNSPTPCQFLDYREVAPEAASRDMYVSRFDASRNGALAVGVPGVPAGLLMALEKWGTMPRQKLLQRPIEIAKTGYVFTTHSESAAMDRWKSMNAEAKRLFGCKTKEGLKPCPPGTVVRQPELAKVLQTLSKSGARGFYEGPVAQKIVDGIQKGGGILSLRDLKKYHPVLRAPLEAQVEEFQVVSAPPPSSGGLILIQLLSYADRAEKTGSFKEGFGSPHSIHALTQAMLLAFADRAHYFGDPDFVKMTVGQFLSPDYLNQQWKIFDADEMKIPTQGGDLPPEPQHTTHFSVIDRDGNAVALTTTVNDNFGSGFVPPGTGIVMNNEMDDFSAHPGVPNLFGLVGMEANAIAPRKRPLSSMSPTILRDQNGFNRLVIGGAGGPRIPTAVFLTLFNRLQFGMSLPDAMAAPRFHNQWKPETLKLEKDGFSFQTRTTLKKMGYSIEEVPSLAKVHALERFSDGRTCGVPDPRGEGFAVAE